MLVDLGLVEVDFECSNVCPILPGIMGIWQLDKMVEHPNQIQPNQVHEQMGHLVCMFEIRKIWKMERNKRTSYRWFLRNKPIDTQMRFDPHSNTIKAGQPPQCMLSIATIL